MNQLTEWIVERPRAVLTAWIILIAVGGYFSTHLSGVLRGSADGMPGSPSDRVMQAITRSFGPDAAFVIPIVVHSPSLSVQEPGFGEGIVALEQALIASGHARTVRHFWNGGDAILLGADKRSALLLVTPRARSFYDAELLVDGLRDRIRSTTVTSAFSVSATGPVAVFHDMNRHSANDLLAAERVGVPITLVILLIVFGAPLAASLPLVLAFTAVVISLALLFALSFLLPISIFARNAVTMIGLGVGVDYALFLIARFRDELADGHRARDAVVRAATSTGHTVVVSGMTVAAGFLALFLVRVPLMHSLAIGGAAVVTIAVAATLTLLPVLLSLIGERIFWPFRTAARHDRRGRGSGLWYAWAQVVMRRPWFAFVPAFAIVALFIAPAIRIDAWNPGAKDLPLELEARQGAEILEKSFTAGWLGPIILAIEAEGAGTVWEPARQEAVLKTVDRLARNDRIGHVSGFPVVLSALGPLRGSVRGLDDLPPSSQFVVADAVSRSGNMALVVLLPHRPPESPEVMALVHDLRRDAWPEARAAGLTVSVAGASAAIADFDQELFDSLWRVVPTVLAVTFLMLLVMFRSILIPLKAILLNLLSVLAAWGFLVVVFQDGVGAGLFDLEPPGGLNAFIVIMLFTVLFGLSMDYEVFLLSRIKEERQRGADNATAVALALQSSAGTITSAALVMITIFGAFVFTRLTATREFGLGLAFAVALDASVIRVVLVPALMRLLGDWNWWMPRAGGIQGTGVLTISSDTSGRAAMIRGQESGDESAFRDDTYAVLDRLRKEDPVHHDQELNRWIITDHDLVRDVLRDKDFSVDVRNAADHTFARRISDVGMEPEAHASMLGLDDPDHRRLRSFVSRAFAPNAIEGMRASVTRIVEEVLAPLRARESFDLIREFASPIPFLVLAGMLGVDASDQPEFTEWAQSKARELDPHRSEETRVRIANANARLNEYFRRLISARRAHPKEDLISDLVRANERGEMMTEDEIVTMCSLLIVAGTVTTTDLIGNGTLALLRHPEQWLKLRQRPQLVVNAVEEMLRFDSPVIQTGRITTKAVELGNRRVPKGESISLSLGAANHDPKVYRDPHRFDIERADTHHQSFGGGIHLCLGAGLARLEAQIAISGLLQAFPSLRLASNVIVRKGLPVFRGCQELIVLTG